MRRIVYAVLHSQVDTIQPTQCASGPTLADLASFRRDGRAGTRIDMRS